LVVTSPRAASLNSIDSSGRNLAWTPTGKASLLDGGLNKSC